METHLIVLWENARTAQERILADIARHVEIVARLELNWPGDPQSCYERFYGITGALAAGKVTICGGGPFLAVIVRDYKPRYGWRETSRGFAKVNLRLFAMKKRYRSWTGASHRIHTTNSPLEARHDIYLLTGHSVDEWNNAAIPLKDCRVLPGWNGWQSLRELFAALNETVPYVVMRNFEMLPDAFDSSIHGDIDLLVSDVTTCAAVLGATKVFPESYRVHYAVTVGGEPIRFDFRSIGDGYYAEQWQRDILAHRVRKRGVYLPCPEDAFAMLTYHAILQKFRMSPDYKAKICDLAHAANHDVKRVDEAFPILEAFLWRHHYAYSTPHDKSVIFNDVITRGHDIARRIELSLPITNLQPTHLENWLMVPSTLSTLIFEGTHANGERCFIKYYHSGGVEMMTAEWKYGTLFHKALPDAAPKPLAYHVWPNGSAVIAHEWVDGITLEEAQKIGNGAVATLSLELERIADALLQLGISHRDIRPANLILKPDGHLALIDFQFATEINAKEETQFLLDNIEFAMVLGDAQRMASGLWNDRHSFIKIIEAFPDFDAKQEICERLREKMSEAMRPMRLRGHQLRSLERQYRRLKRHNFWRKLRGKTPRDLELMAEFLSSCGTRFA